MVRARPISPLYTQYGGTMNVFRGRRSQRGHGIGGVLKGLFRSAMPLIKKGAKSLGKIALETGVQVANDVMSGKKFKSSLKTRGKQAGRKLIGQTVDGISQRGNGNRRRRKKGTRKHTPTKHTSRKKGN